MCGRNFFLQLRKMKKGALPSGESVCSFVEKRLGFPQPARLLIYAAITHGESVYVPVLGEEGTGDDGQIEGRDVGGSR